MNSITGTPSLTFLDLKNSEDRIRTLVSIYDPSLTDEDLKKCQNDPDPYDLMDDRIELIVNEILPILDLDTPPCDDALRQLSLDKFQHECDLRDVPG
ncbi:MAG: hypothetical protein KDK72_08695, partial [Chlamydiia bacterium]|nr:hypothetical protein [Chlamydiia bacterium]